MKDFYYILGITNNADQPEIEAAYRKLARKLSHASDEPDDFIDGHFRDIAEAYDVLRDAGRRSKYDEAFRRNQKRYFAAFRLKYLNIAVTLTFLAVTALFAYYIIHALRGHPAKQQAPKTIVQPTLPPVAHIKKHHKTAAPVIHRGQVPASKPAVPIAPHPAPPDSYRDATPPPKPDSTNTATLHANITGIIYLHESADYNSAVIAKIPDAAQVRVLQKGSAWYKVSYNAQVGYVLKSSVE